MASSGLPSTRTRVTIARAAAAYQRPQWKVSPSAGVAGWSAATPDPAAIRRRDSSIARRRRPATLTAAYDPNGGSTPGFALGSTTRVRGAGRSAICRPARLEAVELLEVHQVVHAREEEPLPAAKVSDQWVVQRAGLRLVARNRIGRGGKRATALAEQG